MLFWRGLLAYENLFDGPLLRYCRINLSVNRIYQVLFWSNVEIIDNVCFYGKKSKSVKEHDKERKGENAEKKKTLPHTLLLRSRLD